MNKYYTIIILLLVNSIKIFSQNNSIIGQVYDSETKKEVPLANIIILSRIVETPLDDPQNKLVKGEIADKNGRFNIKSLTPGKYVLKISHIGYQTFYKPFDINRSPIDEGKIFIIPGSVETQEVEIIEKVPPVVVKKDTIEFNSNAFKTNKDADAEQLISKMPGITVQDGRVQAQGENIRKVLVDGKQVFGEDPTAALRNIPAEIVDKIQVFDQQSEQAQFTGFDDGNTSKTVNLITRMGFRQGTFGKLSAGYGDEERYRAGGNVNFFNDNQRITLLGQINNVNEQNFSMEDILGVMGGGGGRMGGRGGFMGGAGQLFSGMAGGGMRSVNFRGGPMSDFFVNTLNGLSTTKAFGVNYSNVFGEKSAPGSPPSTDRNPGFRFPMRDLDAPEDKNGNMLEMTGSYFFNNTNSDAKTFTSREYFLSQNAGQNYNEENISVSKNLNHRFNLRLDYTIDSSNSILFTPRFSFQKNDANSFVFGQTNEGLTALNSTSYLYNSNLSALNSSAELLYRHRFEKKGRTISVSINPSYYKNDGETNLFSESIYYDRLSFSQSQSTKDTTKQLSTPDVNGLGGSSNLIYTEPIGETGQLQLNARVSVFNDESDKKTFSGSDNSYSTLDTLLSNVYKKRSITQSYGSGYRFKKDNLTFILRINYSITKLESEQTFPYSSNVEKSFYSFLPSFNLRYGSSRDQNINFWYRTNNNEPSVEQLQNVLDNSNPIRLSTGNPGLKQDYSHTIMMNYSKINITTLNSFFILFSGTYTNNYIGSNIIIADKDTITQQSVLLRRGMQLTIPANIDGYFNLRSFITYGLPVGFVKSNLNFNLMINYTRTPGIINNVTSYAKSGTYGFGITWSSNFSQNLDITLSSNSSYNVIENSIQSDNNDDYFNQNTRFRFYWNFWEGIVLQSDLNHQYDSGLPEEYRRDTFLWNLSIGKKLFSNDRGEIRFSANDILNQNTNIQRNNTSSYIEDTRSNTLGRYFLISFIYDLRAF
jgi:hypothetical protein